MEDLKVAINKMSEQLSALSGTKELCEGMKLTLDDLLQRVKANEDRCTKVMTELSVYKHENQLLKRRITLLEEKAVYAESYSRRSNLVFDGIPLSQGNEDIEAKVREVLSVNMKVQNVEEIQFVRVHRLAYKRKTIVRFEHFQDRMRVWQNRRQLKGSNIWVEEDFPKEIRDRRQVLMPIFKKALTLPHVKAYLVEDRLSINGETYTVQNLQQLPPALSLDLTSLVVHEDNVFFFSRSSPLSNFFPSQFKMDGMEYRCVEQRYQSMKAEVHKESKLSDEVMMANDPAEMYNIGNRKLRTDGNIWTEGRKLRIMEDALMEKFTQNSHLKDVLLSTAGKNIVKAGPDVFWGTGVKLNKIKEIPQDNWPGQNRLGKLLMSKRAKLQEMEQ